MADAHDEDFGEGGKKEFGSCREGWEYLVYDVELETVCSLLALAREADGGAS